MKGIKLKTVEERKYEVIKKLVSTRGNKKRASLALMVTVRTVDRLIKKYQEEGKEGFLHKNTGKSPSWTINGETKKHIVKLYEEKYYDTNFRHFKELLFKNEGINLSYTFIYKLLKKNFILSPKPYKSTKAKMKKLLKEKLDSGKELNKLEKKLLIQNNIISPKYSHARLPRSKYFGESVQMDASNDYWFNGVKSFLHGAIDCNTGRVLGLYFTKEETLKGYYSVLRQILSNYGIPYEFVTDRRTIFVYQSKNSKSLENDTHTQFGYACKELGINLVTTSVAQKKGRIERLWETLQGRLIPEMRLANIKTLEEANKFVIEYLKSYNKKFSLPPNYTTSVFEKIDKKSIDNYLSVISNRTVDKGSSIKYKNKYYQPFSKDKLINFIHKTNCLVIETFKGELLCNVDNEIYRLIEVPLYREYSKNFDIKIPKKEQNKKEINICNPWKKEVFDRYLSEKNKDEIGAYN